MWEHLLCFLRMQTRQAALESKGSARGIPSVQSNKQACKTNVAGGLCIQKIFMGCTAWNMSLLFDMLLLCLLPGLWLCKIKSNKVCLIGGILRVVFPIETAWSFWGDRFVSAGLALIQRERWIWKVCIIHFITSCSASKLQGLGIFNPHRIVYNIAVIKRSH